MALVFLRAPVMLEGFAGRGRRAVATAYVGVGRGRMRGVAHDGRYCNRLRRRRRGSPAHILFRRLPHLSHHRYFTGVVIVTPLVLELCTISTPATIKIAITTVAHNTNTIQLIGN